MHYKQWGNLEPSKERKGSGRVQEEGSRAEEEPDRGSTESLGEAEGGEVTRSAALRKLSKMYIDVKLKL